MTRRLLTLVTLAFLLTGCAAGQGLVATSPTADQVQAVRQKALVAANTVTTALGILDETGRLLNDLPIPDSAKDRYDCAILAVTGTSTPASPAVTRVCGAVPLAATAPLSLALESLGGVSTCPALRSTLSVVYGWVAPLIVQLEVADNAALKMAGASLRVTLTLLSGGTVSCL